MSLNKFFWVVMMVFFMNCGTKKNVVKTYKKTTPKKTIVRKPIIKTKEKVVEPTIVVTPAEKQVEAKVVQIDQPLRKETGQKLDITQEYLNRYASIAVREMHIYKIPASITLAQGVLESGSGRSPLAIKSNNHFGIKCHKGWKGNSVSHDDDELGECFRKYKHPETSYEDHSKFLTSRSRYSGLFKLRLTDYSGWAYGLKKAGYATDIRYPRKLIAIIKKYNLDQYDLVNSTDSSIVYADTVKEDKPMTAHTVSKGDTLYSLSKKYMTTVEKIKEINGLVDNVLSIDQELLMP